MNLKELPIHYINKKRYWRMEQVLALQVTDGDYGNNDVCTGCAFRSMRSDASFSCREVKDDRLSKDNQPLRCQDYEVDLESYSTYDEKFSDYNILKDYIFIPATRAGFAQYVAHKLETS